ncbi:MAG: fluoride efflux transporter FluC [Acidimicrobiales bacterium]
MTTGLLFVTVAALGATARWIIVSALPPLWGTFSVNVAGSFALGLLDDWSAPKVTVLGVGALGALTTFSTLTDEVGTVARTAPLRAGAYLGATLVAGIAAASAGVALAG